MDDLPSLVILQDRPLPMHNWKAFCPCGGSFRIPDGLYDRDGRGRLVFMRPLRENEVAGTPISFEVAFARRGDPAAIRAALRALRRNDLSPDEAAEVVERVAPQLPWLSTWLRARWNELNAGQIAIVIGIISLIIQIWPSDPSVRLNDEQMDELVQRINSPTSEKPSEAEVGEAVQDCLNKLTDNDNDRSTESD